VFCIKTGKKVVIQWYISCHSVVNNMAEVVNFSGSNHKIIISFEKKISFFLLTIYIHLTIILIIELPV